jgi:hypothetical protein
MLVQLVANPFLCILFIYFVPHQRIIVQGFFNVVAVSGTHGKVVTPKF